MRFVSRSVITGFVNALAILIFMAQLPELIGVPDLTYVMVAAGLAIIYLFPLLTKAVPSPLVCIVVLTAVVDVASGWICAPSATWASCPSAFPVFLLPDVPLTWETLQIILPYSVTLAVGRSAGIADDGVDRRRTDRHGRATRTANASARASPTSPPASSAAWRAAP